MSTQKPSNGFPKRGDIFVANLDPSLDRETQKKRPILVISTNVLNQNLSTIIMIPFSSIVPNVIGPDLVKVKAQKTGLNKDSVIVASQIRGIDKSRLFKKMGKVSSATISEVENALKIVLGFEPVE